MKILSIFLLFLIAEKSAGLHQWRRRSGINANDILVLVEKTSKFGKFQRPLRGEFKQMSRGIVNNTVTRVNGNLETMIDLLVRRSYRYLLCNLYEYFELVVAETEKQNDAKTIRQSIRFPEDYEHCILTLFFDFGYNVELLFESTYYFQTFTVADDYPIVDLKTQAERYRKIFGDHLKTKNCPLPIITEEFTDRLTAIKRTITDFSNVFCSRWSPFVRDFLVAKTGFQDNRNPSRFVDYVFQNEKCSITEQAGQKYTIFGMILDCTCLRYSERERQCTEWQSELSLGALKRELKPNNYFLNAVLYYNVAAEVVTLVAIKEGNRLLKGIRRVVTSDYCAESLEEKIVGDMLEMWTALITFKSLLDELLVLILKEKRIDFRDDPRKFALIRNFHATASQILHFLADPKHRNESRTRQNCNAIIANLNALKADELDSPIKAKLKKYSFTRPILHIVQLYRFSEDFFL